MISVNQAFHDAAKAPLIPFDWGVNISFPKVLTASTGFFILNQSMLNGNDLLAPNQSGEIQNWDKYDYSPFGDRVVSVEWSREIDFPYSVQSALADFILDNHDGYFDPLGSSPIADNILPKRPVKIFAGFQNVGEVQNFVGLADVPEFSTATRQASFHCKDWLAEMYSLELDDVIAMQDARVDEVLEQIFLQFGMEQSQFQLAEARLTIPFVFYEQGKNAGNVMRELMQAEMGRLWIDEEGIVRFEPRLESGNLPVMILDESRIVSIRHSGLSEIINTIRIDSAIREVQQLQPVYSNVRSEGGLAQQPSLNNAFVIPANSDAFYPNANLENPCLSVNTPTLGELTSDSWFTAVTTNSSSVSNGVTISFDQLNANNYVMKFTNSNNFDVIIDQVVVWGQPAKVVDTIKYSAYDDNSVDKYGKQVLKIENDFLGSVANCESLAYYTLDGFKDYGSVIELEVKGDPSLQLGDVVTVDAENYSDNYKITKIRNRMTKFKYSQILTMRHYTSRDYFQLDKDILNGNAVLAP